MKVAFDTSPLSSGHRSRGVGYYTKNLLDRLKFIQDLEVVEFNSKKSPRDVDLVHYPFFDLFYHTLPIRQPLPTVVTIHDITPLIYPKHYPPGLKGRVNLELQKLSLKNVRAVITVSEASKKDIVNYFNIDPNKIYVTYEAPSLDYKALKTNTLSSLKKRFGLPDKFSLYIGNVNWNKNIINLTQASIDAGLDLIIVGSSFTKREDLNHPEMRDYKEFLSRFKNNSMVHILGYVDQTDLVGIMNLAELLLFPSRYEGFGLPVLEAQSCGIPVITSKISSLPEVSGDGAIFVDPESISEICEAIKKVSADKILRDKLVKAGFKNVARFSWEKTAQQTASVYKYATKS